MRQPAIARQPRKRYIALLALALLIAVIAWQRHPIARYFAPPNGSSVVIEIDGDRYPTARGSYCYNGFIPGTGACSDYAGFPVPSPKPLVVGRGDTARIVFPYGEPKGWSATNLHLLPAPNFGGSCTAPPCQMNPGGRSDVLPDWPGASADGTLTWPDEPGDYLLDISAEWSGGQVSYGIWVMIPGIAQAIRPVEAQVGARGT